MHLIERMIAAKSERPLENRVELTVERRKFLKRRWRATASDGTDFGFDLESRLTDGCVIFQDGHTDYIVRQLPETVYEVAFSSPAEGTLIGWKVGNLHLPAQIMEGSLRVLHDDAMKQLLEREGWEFTEPEVLFTPMKAMAH
jgi:urease accessory protein